MKRNQPAELIYLPSWPPLPRKLPAKPFERQYKLAIPSQVNWMGWS